MAHACGHCLPAPVSVSCSATNRDPLKVMTYASNMTLSAKILTISDSVTRGLREDVAGPMLVRRLEAAGFNIVEHRVVADGIDSVVTALRELSFDFKGLILTTGGTGFSPRDLTPEATMLVLDREAPGFGEVMRSTSPYGPLSRGRSGTLGQALILNTPGSPAGALESLEAVLALLPHALELLEGRVGPHPPDTGGTTAISS